MAYGTLAHTVGKKPLAELVKALEQYNELEFVQLAMSKAIGDIDTGNGRLSPGLANVIREAFAKAGIRIGVLGCYINPVHPDPAARRQEIDRFKEHIRFAHWLGVPTVATETGELDLYEDHDEGWGVLRETVKELAEEAERWGVNVGLGPVSTHTLSTPEKMRRILDEVPSSTLGVVFDPCNLIDKNDIGSQDDLVERSFRLFGDRIVLVHLKDLITPPEGWDYVRAGGGGLFHTEAFLAQLHKYKPFVDISLEALTPETIDEGIRFVKDIYSTISQ